MSRPLSAQSIELLFSSMARRFDSSCGSQSGLVTTRVCCFILSHPAWEQPMVRGLHTAAGVPSKPTRAPRPKGRSLRAFVAPKGLSQLWDVSEHLRQGGWLFDGGYFDPNLSADVKHCLALSGRAWSTALLSRKSTADLQKLWYVLLKEKNFLLSERHAFLQHNCRPKGFTRLRKVRLGMRRILRVISRREIHEQIIRGQDILDAQTQREKLETQRFQLEETIKELRCKLERFGLSQSLQKTAWIRALKVAAEKRDKLLLKLEPLRQIALQAVTPDWRYSKRFSDLPGNMSWKPQYVKALADRHRLIPRRY